MSDSLYAPSTYDRVHAKYTHEQCINGGRKRASTAKRHPVYKIFLPDNDLWNGEIMFPSTYRHGEAGGKARARTAKRCNGKFAKNDTVSN